MKILYLDMVGGIAGDMTVAALIELGVPLHLLREGLGTLGLKGLAIASEEGARHQIAGTRFVVTPPHGDGYAHHHPHRPYREVREILAAAGLPPRAREMAQAVFAKLAEAEGQVHGVPPGEVTFHEVGAWDAIADVVCTALAVDFLAPRAVFCSPVPLGGGSVKAAHGVVPIPAPATLLLLRGFPTVTGGPAYERTTPTGAAILAALARPAPEGFAFTPEKVGVGLGTHDGPEVPNLLRAVLGEAAGEGAGAIPNQAAPAGAERETIECAEANLDDANPEWIGYLVERLLEAGALDVVLIPAQMKKHRPGTLIQVLYAPALRERVAGLLFSESTTLGVRFHTLERLALPRERAEVTTAWGPVAGKVVTVEGRRRFSPEYEACREVARREGVPLQEVYRAAQAAFEAGGP